MVAPVVGAALRAAQAANKLRKVKKPKKPKKKDTEEMEGALKDFKKGKPKDDLAPAKLMAAGSAGVATQASHSPLSLSPKPEDKKAGGGLARRRRRRKRDGELKVGQRKIARGCGKVQRRKKTLYT